MADEKPADPAWLLMFGGILVASLLLYLLIVSDWYWRCRAQIDPATLTPVICPSGSAPQPARTAPPRTSANAPIEQRVWPDFGGGGRGYEDLGPFWGDDIVSRFFKSLFGLAAQVARPFVVDEVVPRWNEAMWPAINRKAWFAALSLVLGAVTKEWAKDVYRALRRSKPAAE
ncbi:MAG: hypothetical protein QFE16_04030 [Pseudomonadota bacterium]|nr:hypothetical protein [Pseudomonadota bacterium]